MPPRLALRGPLGSAVLAIVILHSLISCSIGGAIWIVPGSTAQHLVFCVGRWQDDYKPIEIHHIEVDRAGRSLEFPGPIYWESGADPSNGDAPFRVHQIAYGSTLFRRYPGDIPVQSLRPGRYVVIAYLEGGRTAHTVFSVQTDGVIVEDH
jgi:hypothetical protein